MFSVLLALRLPRLGKRGLIVVLFVRLFDLRLFGFVCFLFLLVSGKGCGLWPRLRFVASGPTVKLASCKIALNLPVVYSTDRSKAMVPVLVLLFVALWFILQGDLFYVLPSVILFLCFSVILALGLPRLGKVIVVLFVCLFDVCLFGFVGFLFLFGVWEGLRFVIVALPGFFSYLFCDCGTPWTFPLPFFFICFKYLYVLAFIYLQFL